jgi:hypothetical protein
VSFAAKRPLRVQRALTADGDILIRDGEGVGVRLIAVKW